MNKIKSRLAMLLAVILLTGSLQGPVFAVQSGQGGADAGVSAQKGTVDPDQVVQTEPLDLVPEEDPPEDPPEDEFFTVSVEMDGGYGGVYNGDVFDDALGEYVTDASSFVKKVKKGEAVEFMPGSLYIGGEHQHDFLGWSLEPGGEIVGTKTSYTPTEDCTLYANWTSHVAFVLMDDDHFPDGSRGKTAYADRDGWVTVPEAPVSGTQGWRFYRWIWYENGEPVEIQDGKFHIDYNCTVNPDWRDIKVEEITLDRTELSLGIGETAQLQVASIMPEDALSKEITWKSNDEVTASVDENGVVTGLRRGTTTVMAYVSDGGGARALCTVNVDGGKTLVTFDANGGSFQGRFWDAEAEGYVEDPVSFSREDVGFGASFSSNEMILHSDPSMRFRGWSLTADGEPVIGKTENYKTDQNVTLYAVWEPVYVVTIDMNGGNYLALVHDDALGEDVTSPGSFVWEIKKGDALAFEENRICYSSDHNRAFIGWSLEPEGEIAGTKTGYTPTEDCTLYAVWTKYACFEVRGGSFEDGSAFVRKMADENGFVDVPGMIPVCDDENRIFSGWTLTEGGSPVDVSPEGKIQITQDCTLIPVWIDKGSSQPEDPQEDTYTITIDCNGGYLPGTHFDDEKQENVVNPSSFVKKIRKGESLNIFLSKAWIDDSHKTIAGWSLEPGGSIAVYPLTSSSYVPQQDCTLYAVWEDAYSVTLDLNGGYYTSAFWNGETLEYESHLRERVTKVQCGNGVDFNASSLRHDDSSMQLVGWSAERNGDIVSNEYGWYFPENDCTLYAVWGRSHLVTVDLGSGHFGQDRWDSVEGRYVKGESIWHERVGEGGRVALVPSQIVPADPSLILVGWSLEPDGALILDRYAAAYEIQEDCTLYAIYDHFHTVTVDYRFGRSGTSVFDDQSGYIRTDTQSYVKIVRQGEAMELYPDSAHYPVDYSPHDFGGWSLEPDGSLLEDNYSFIPTEDCTIYAVWTSHAIFRADGGRFPDGDLSVRANADRDNKVLVPEEIPLADDETKVFDGWCREGSTNKITIDQEGKTSIPYNVTFVPVWKDKPQDDPGETTWTVIFDANGGTFPDGKTQISIKIEKGERAYFRTEPVTEEDKALIFTGWNLPDGTFISKEDLGSFVPEGDTTFTAVWKKSVESLALSETSITLNTGETTVLKKIVHPGDATDKRVSWKSSNTKIATVDAKGNVKAVSKGTATITATTKDGTGISASCTVTVKQPVTKLTLNKTSLTLMRTKTFALTATASPSNANNKAVTWKSSNTKAATVDSKGNVKAVAKGTATITATAKDGSGVKAVCKVTVTQPVTKITLNKTSLSLNRGKTYTLKAAAGPASANNKAVKWSTSNKAVATVSSKGVVKAVKKGTAVITATAADGSGKKAACKITVRQPVTGLKINRTTLTVTKGKTAALKVTVSPSNANNKTLKWTTSNKAVATVTSKGVVKGIKRGTATITAAATDGSNKKVTCKITVK